MKILEVLCMCTTGQQSLTELSLMIYDLMMKILGNCPRDGGYRRNCNNRTCQDSYQLIEK